MWVDPWVGKTPCSRKWQLTPVFFPGKFQGHRSLVGHSAWVHKELDMSERLSTQHRNTGHRIEERERGIYKIGEKHEAIDTDSRSPMTPPSIDAKEITSKYIIIKMLKREK